MTRYCTRPLTEQDLDERANLLNVYSNSPVWTQNKPTIAHYTRQSDYAEAYARTYMEWAQSSNGVGCVESGAMPEMACVAPAETDDKPGGFWAGFWSFLKAPKPDFSR